MVQKSLPESAQHAPKRTTESSAVPKVEEKPRYNALDASSAAESDPFYIDTIHVKIIRNFLDRSLDLDINANRANCLRAGEEDKSFIHRTILRLKSLNRQAPDSLIDFIGSLVLEKPELATTADAENRVPILEAARFQVKIFYHIIDLIIPNRTRDQLKTACETGGQACPLWEIAEGRLNRHLLKGQTIVRRSEDTSRCLHDRVDLYGLLDADRILRHTIQVSLAAQGGETCLQYLIQETKFDSGFRGGDQIIPLETFKALIQLYPDSTFTSPLATGLSPLQSAIQLYESQSIDYELLYHVIEALVGRSPHSIFFCEPEGKSSRVSYRLLKDLKDVPKNKDSRLRAEELLKTTCIGAREIEYAKEKESSTKGLWVQKKNFLYWDAKLERQFMLNLTGGSLVLDEPYIKTIVEKSNIRFETVLDFVKLPYWNRPAKALLKSIENSSGNAKTVPKVGTGPYRHIFDWLYKRGVRKIFTIDVDDDGPDPHTNATIRDALAKEPSKGVERCDFQVEVWKWKKFDICTDTIYEAAPTVKEVHLFSHGNTAVLKGWASPSGLARLPELTSLTINISPKNKHDATDCSFMEKDFKEQLVKQCNKLSSQNITINNHGLLNKNTPSDKHTEPETQCIGKPTKAEMKLKPDEWISRLANCQQFLKGINLEEKPSVKVALLDNGCNLTDLHTVQQGKSFNSFRSEYCIGDCEHGTEMARCIQSVWSKTELYVARLGDSRTEENQRFTISSCHEALQWALDMDVDIISMSWTFRRDDVNDAHKKKFVELVQEIVSSKKVILFASLPDGGPSIRIGNYAPVGLDGVIRIGSATVYGISSNDNFYAEPDFLLPGEQILPSGEQARGSSYATAHAAGLAAMVLYLVKVYCELEVDPPFNLEHAISEAKSCEGMAHMFRKLSQNNTGKRARHGDFVQPYRSFPNDFNSGLSERAILSGIVSEILPPTVRIPATY